MRAIIAARRRWLATGGGDGARAYLAEADLHGATTPEGGDARP
jgi:hypothetical protein